MATIIPLYQSAAVPMLYHECRVLPNYQGETTTQAGEPERGEGEAVNLVLDLLSTVLVRTDDLASLHDVEDDQVTTQLDTELAQGGGSCLAHMEVKPEYKGLTKNILMGLYSYLLMRLVGSCSSAGSFSLSALVSCLACRY